MAPSITCREVYISLSQPHTAIDIRTVAVLIHGDRLLLLQRAPWKTFAPNRWTGVGGKVEPNERGNLEAAARRELFEETDLAESEVSNLRLLRTLFFHHPQEGLVCLLYFVGEALTDRVPTCNEGSLRWVHPDELSVLDLIENTGRVLPLLVEDVRHGDRTVRCGTASYDDNGQIQSIEFAASSSNRQ